MDISIDNNSIIGSSSSSSSIINSSNGSGNGNGIGNGNVIIEDDTTMSSGCCICKQSVGSPDWFVKCGKCGIVVHRTCYFVNTIDNNDSNNDMIWYCKPCTAGADPDTLTCELCSNKGGAYLYSEKRSWVHNLCANWISDIKRFRDFESQEVFVHLGSLDRTRFKYKCCLCNKRGAAIRCVYPRCETNAHPWCLLNDTKGSKGRISIDEDGEGHYEMFCRVHADAATSLPFVKPKTAKTMDVENEGQDVSIIAPKESHVIENKHPYELSMAHMLDFDTVNSLDKFADMRTLSRRKSSFSITKSSSSHSLTESPREEKQPSDDIDNGNPDDNQQVNQIEQVKKFPLPTMTEWPGQTEGNPMDLEHFWKVISQYFPEDFPADWADYMKKPFTTMQLYKQEDPCFVFPEFCVPIESSPTDDDNLITPFSSERQKANIYNKSIRYENLENLKNKTKVLLDSIREVQKYIDLNGHQVNLNDSAAQCLKSDQVVNTNMSDSNDNDDDLSEEDDDSPFDDAYSYLEKESIVKSVGDAIPTLHIEKPSANNQGLLRVVFEGNRERVACEYGVSVAKSDQLPICLECSDQHNAWVNKYLVSGEPHNDQKEALTSAKMDLLSSTELNDDYEIYLSDRILSSKNESDELCRALRSDTNAYREICQTVDEKLRQLLSLDTSEYRSDLEELKRKHCEIEAMYSKQQIWRKIVKGADRGMKDHNPDTFNKQEKEQLPASWTLNVDGRKLHDDDDDGPVEDAVCMCCFDGSSPEENSILFCDGCNATMHQACYGVSEVPQGDFFCDRCRSVRVLAYNNDNILDKYDGKDIIKCCLCPQYHGGIKPTSDGRWVHLCCALWSESSTIGDVNEMGPIDVSNVPLQLPTRVDILQRLEELPADYNDSQSNTPLCLFCNVQGGFLKQCAHSSECNTYFHPICAWFNGLFVKVNVTDYTFKGLERDGIYPSGVNFSFYCSFHCPPDVDIVLRNQQVALRGKYQIKKEDLDQVPGHNKRKRKQKPIMRKDQRISTAIKDLKEDVFDEKCCAMCLNPSESFDSAVNNMLIKLHAEMSSIEMTTDPENTAGANESMDISFNSNNNLSTMMSTSSPMNIAVTGSPLNGMHNLPAGSPTTALDIMSVVPTTNVMDSPISIMPPMTSGSPGMVIPTSQTNAQVALTSDIVAYIADQASNQASSTQDPTSAATEFNFSQWFGSLSRIYQYPVDVNGQLIEHFTCTSCNITVHTKCIIQSGGILFLQGGWKCDRCVKVLLGLLEPSDLRCILCPRRGGCYKLTDDGHLVHLFCAKKIESYRDCVKLTPSGFLHIDTRNVPKDMKRQRCDICNRKDGVSFKCNQLGCNFYFHSSCAHRSGKAYTCARGGSQLGYCSEHIPEMIFKMESGHWIDAFEINKLRCYLDRARIILDMIVRREKMKSRYTKTDGDYQSRYFQSSLAKAKGRKFKAEGDSGIADDESVNEDTSVVDDTFLYAGDNVWQQFEGVPTGESMLVTLGTGEEVEIGPRWNNKGVARCPQHLHVSFAGIELNKQDLNIKGDKKKFIAEMKVQTNIRIENTRPSCNIFQSEKEASAFKSSISNYLKDRLKMDKDAFKKEMTKRGIKMDFDKIKPKQPKLTTEVSGFVQGPPKVPKPRGRPSQGKKENLVEKAVVVAAENSAEKAAERAAVKATVKAAEKAAEKVAEETEIDNLIFGDKLVDTPVLPEKRKRGFQKGHKINLKKKHLSDGTDDIDVHGVHNPEDIGHHHHHHQDFSFDLHSSNALLDDGDSGLGMGISGSVFEGLDPLDDLLGEDSLFGREDLGI